MRKIQWLYNVNDDDDDNKNTTKYVHGEYIHKWEWIIKPCNIKFKFQKNSKKRNKK